MENLCSKLIEIYYRLVDGYSAAEDSIKWTKTVLKDGETVKVYTDEAERVIKLAKEGMPEAIFFVSLYRKTAREELSGIIDADIISLFGSSENSLYRKRCLEKQLEKEPKNRDLKAKIDAIDKNRNAIIVGNDGVYEEEMTWKHIRDDILPIATEDIWNDVNDLYNGEGACVPSSDREEFNLKLNDYLSRRNHEGKIPITEPQKKNSKQAAAKTDFEAVLKDHSDNLIWISNKLKKQTKEITAEKLLTALNFIMAPANGPEILLAETWYQVQKVMDKVEENAIDDVMVDQSFEKQKLYADALVSFYDNGLPVKWADALKRIFNSSLNSEKYSYWISFLDKIGMLTDYAYDAVFWTNINSSFLNNLVANFKSCLTPESFLNFYYLLRETAAHTTDKRMTVVENVWTHFSYKTLFDISSDSRMRQFRNFMEKTHGNEGDHMLMMENLFSAASSEVDLLKKDIFDSREKETIRSKYMADEFAAAYKSMESIEKVAFRFDDSHDARKYSVFMDLVSSIKNVKDSFAYFLDRNWGIRFETAESMSNFTGTEVEYDSDRHVSVDGSPIEPGEKVLLKSFGVKLNGTVKYKAKVEKERN